jgi:indolepyruvate ferredoxin oxidoreductase
VEGFCPSFVTVHGGSLRKTAISQTLGMAAHLDGLRCTILDVTGLAQKYGAVMSHVRIAADENLLGANRISTGEADTLIGCEDSRSN